MQGFEVNTYKPQRERAGRLRHWRLRRRSRFLRRQDARRQDLQLLGHPALPRRSELPAAPGQPAQRPSGDEPARRPDGILRRPRRGGAEPPHKLRAEHAGRPTGGGLPDPRRARARSSRGA
jgi:hypothetical protein